MAIEGRMNARPPPGGRGQPGYSFGGTVRR